jgi:hypothetical protein
MSNSLLATCSTECTFKFMESTQQKPIIHNPRRHQETTNPLSLDKYLTKQLKYAPVFWPEGVATFAFLSETGVFRAFSAALFLPTSG